MVEAAIIIGILIVGSFGIGYLLLGAIEALRVIGQGVLEILQAVGRAFLALLRTIGRTLIGSLRASGRVVLAIRPHTMHIFFGLLILLLLLAVMRPDLIGEWRYHFLSMTPW